MIGAGIIKELYRRWLHPLAVRLYARWVGFRAGFFREVLRAKLIALRVSKGKPLLVFVRFGAIGDIICTFPAAGALIRKHPDLHFVYVTLSEFKLLPTMGGIGGSVASSGIHCGIPQLPSWVVSICLQPRYIDESGTANSSRHLIDEFLSACGFDFFSEGVKAARLTVPKDVKESVNRRLQSLNNPSRPLVAIHTGPTWPVRQWDDLKWAELVRLLRVEFDCTVLHVGSARHVELGKRALGNVPGTETLIGHLSLEDLVGIVERVDLVIGVDSGILHLAGAVGTASVGIFGPTNPEFRVPRHATTRGVSHNLPCSFCHHRYPRLHWITGCPYDVRCMKEVSPYHVFDACVGVFGMSHTRGKG